MEIGCGTERKRYAEIVLLHLIGAIMILMCHFFQKAHIASLGELFISGVPLFLFVSGFLAGLKPEIEKSWLKKRFIRILTPYYLWVVPCILILWLSDHTMLTISQPLFLLTNMQGLNYIYWKSELYGAVSGLGHLWFTTEIMLCYLLVPLFQKVLNMIGRKKSTWLIIMSVIIIVIQPLAIQIGIQTSYIITFFLGYLVCKLGCKITNRLFSVITLGCVGITAVRFVLMRIMDGTNYYDRYFALISAAAIGIWIFFCVFWLSSKAPIFITRLSENKLIAFLSEISFEIYIVHYWFLNGKWQVSNYIHNAVLSDMLVVVLTVIFASVLHLISQKVVCRLNRKVAVR